MSEPSGDVTWVPSVVPSGGVHAGTLTNSELPVPRATLRPRQPQVRRQQMHEVQGMAVEVRPSVAADPFPTVIKELQEQDPEQAKNYLLPLLQHQAEETSPHPVTKKN